MSKELSSSEEGNHKPIRFQGDLKLYLLLAPVEDVTEDEDQRSMQALEVVQAKNGGGSATLSMAYAANMFIQQFLRALNGETGIVENAFIRSDAWQEVSYLAGLVELGRRGVEKVHPFPTFNANEQDLFSKALVELKKDIAKGVAFAKQ